MTTRFGIHREGNAASDDQPRRSTPAEPSSPSPLIDSLHGGMQQAQAERRSLEDRSSALLGDLVRAEFELLERLHVLEPEVCTALGCDREAGMYRAVFPRGLAVFEGLRGEEAIRVALDVAHALRDVIPEVAERHSTDLERLACTLSEIGCRWRQACADTAQARRHERAIRALPRARGREAR